MIGFDFMPAVEQHGIRNRWMKGVADLSRSLLRARPRARGRGLERVAGPRQLARSRPARRAARLPPLLGGRAPQHAGHRQLGAGRAARATSPPRTDDLRVGSGGVMLPNHAPLVIAEQFGTLEALHPGRIDLGLGRAPGTDRYTAAALRRTVDPRVADDFPGQLAELTALLRRPRRGHPPRRRGRATLPPSGCSARAATARSWPACSACRSPSPATSAPATRCRPSPSIASTSRRPSGCSSRTPWSARRSSAPTATRRRSASSPPRDSRSSTSGEAAPVARRLRPRPSRTATPARRRPSSTNTWRGTSAAIRAPVKAGIEELLEMTAADELMISTSAYDHADRRHSYELVAGLFD